MVKKVAKINNIFSRSILKSIKKPLMFGVLALVASIVAEFLIWEYEFEYTLNHRQLNTLIAIAVGCWFFLEMINRLEENWVRTRSKDSKIDSTTASGITKVLRITTLILVGVLVMQVFGFSFSALWAFAGGGGVVAGFAAKDMLANFFGALSIYLDKPFKVGDWISSPDKNIEGHVEEIGLRITKIRTLDKRPLYIQNSVFNTISISNPSKMSHRRLKECIAIRFADINKVHKITKEIKTMLKKNKQIDTSLPIVANLDSYSQPSVDITIVAFTKVIDMEPYHELKQEILLEIGKIIAKHEAKMVHLNTALHVPDID